MSEALFDRQSWNRAFGPAIRALGYFAAGFTVFFLGYLLLLFLASFANLEGVIASLFAILGPIILIFYFILVIFKILDEERILKR